MTDGLDDQIRNALALEAHQAPTNAFLARDVRARVRKSRLRMGGGVLAVVATAGIFATTLGVGSPSNQNYDRGNQLVADSSPSPFQQGALKGSAQESFCVRVYSPTEAARMEFALDGTVETVTPPETNAPESREGLWKVEFRVNRWFTHGSGNRTTLYMLNPEPMGDSEDIGPRYSIGTRLLVSGESAAKAATAWGCGFTRYYDEATAEAWALAAEELKISASSERSD